ncbi:MAG: cytochrome c biogenesis protein ResB [Clostridia bacterium]|nr:cytochrome c biogenesis protein ResB [Clostridia bacterium]
MIKFLSSIQLAVGLIAAIALASVFATLYPTVEVFSSFWFRGLLLLFCLNLLVCTLKSLPAVFARLKKTPANVCGERAEGLEISGHQSVEALTQFIKEKGYKVKMASDGDRQNVLAQKGILSLIAPHLLHLALIVVLVGGYLSSFGVEDQVACFVGEKAEVPASVAEGMVIEVNDFQTVLDAEGAIENWITNFNIYFNDVKAVESGTTKVNAPLKYKGISFYQKSYGYHHLIEVTGEQAGVYQIPDQKIFKLEDKVFNITQTIEGPLVRFFKGHEIVEEKMVKNGEKMEFSEDTVLTYVKTYPFTVLAVKKDPGTWVVMTGFLLMTVASFFFWTGRYREIALSFEGNKAYLTVSCKNKALRDEILAEVRSKLKAGETNG